VVSMGGASPPGVSVSDGGAVGASVVGAIVLASGSCWASGLSMIGTKSWNRKLAQKEIIQNRLLVASFNALSANECLKHVTCQVQDFSYRGRVEPTITRR
jgi:hypothetical protein